MLIKQLGSKYSPLYFLAALGAGSAPTVPV